jgi:hypothetical protein
MKTAFGVKVIDSLQFFAKIHFAFLLALLFKSAAPYDKAIAKTRSARVFYRPKKLQSFVHLLAIWMLILQNIGFS